MSTSLRTSTESPADGPPPGLLRALAEAGVIDRAASWTSFGGGRTNRIWRVTDRRVDLVCKIYAAGGDSPLFPNDPVAEALALRALAGLGLAPECVTTMTGTWGTCLIYRHVPGEAGQARPEEVAHTLGRLHAVPPPPGLRVLAGGSASLAAQAQSLLGEVGARGDLPPMPAVSGIGPVADPAFLHADPVPQNIVATSAGAVLIDWQCPAAGDPSEDLAIFLSPAMQLLYAGAPLPPGQVAAFLGAYPRAETCRRYRQLAPLYHWRMAAHCLWKSRRGETEYAAGIDAELKALEALQQ